MTTQNRQKSNAKKKHSSLTQVLMFCYKYTEFKVTITLAWVYFLGRNSGKYVTFECLFYEKQSIPRPAEDYTVVGLLGWTSVFAGGSIDTCTNKVAAIVPWCTVIIYHSLILAVIWKIYHNNHNTKISVWKNISKHWNKCLKKYIKTLK